MNQYVSQGAAVIDLPTDARNTFINRTYGHLTAAIFAFTGILIALFKTGMAERIFFAIGDKMMIVLFGFVILGAVFRGCAHSARSKVAQYGFLSAYVIVEALIFVPIMYYAEQVAPGAIQSAAVITFVGFAGLTATVFITKQDFSFLGGLIKWAGILAILMVVGGAFFGWGLGMWFSVAMVGLAGAIILYTTSNILHHYTEDKYVAASLELFAGVALMLWYVLQLVLHFGDD